LRQEDRHQKVHSTGSQCIAAGGRPEMTRAGGGARSTGQTVYEVSDQSTSSLQQVWQFRLWQRMGTVTLVVVILTTDWFKFDCKSLILPRKRWSN
jgi:hypothetical protein